MRVSQSEGSDGCPSPNAGRRCVLWWWLPTSYRLTLSCAPRRRKRARCTKASMLMSSRKQKKKSATLVNDATRRTRERDPGCGVPRLYTHVLSRTCSDLCSGPALPGRSRAPTRSCIHRAAQSIATSCCASSYSRRVACGVRLLRGASSLLARTARRELVLAPTVGHPFDGVYDMNNI